MALTPEQQAECERLKQLYNEKATMSQKAFAAKYGLGTPGNLWQYLNGYRAIGLEAAIKIAGGLGIQIADFSPRLAEKQRAMSAENVITPLPAVKRIPLLSEVQAGRLVSRGQVQCAAAAIESGDYIVVDEETPDGCFALQIDGDSMSPKFLEGDVIVIDPNLEARPGDYVVGERVCPITGDLETTFKKYRVRGVDREGREVFDLVPLNPDYPTLNSAAEQLTILGVMIEHRRSYRRSR